MVCDHFQGCADSPNQPVLICPPESFQPSRRVAKKPKIEPKREVIAVTGTFTPVARRKTLTARLDVIDPRADSFALTITGSITLHTDPSIDLRAARDPARRPGRSFHRGFDVWGKH